MKPNRIIPILLLLLSARVSQLSAQDPSPTAVPPSLSKTTLPTVSDLFNLRDKDLSDAVESSRKAAEKNDPMGEFNLGVCYDNGLGVPKDYAEAAKWYRKAAEQNLVGAQYNLGFCYCNGQGVPKDYAEAVKWYRKAAEQSHFGAQYSLGVCYSNGQGVSKDEAEAVKWFRKAAEQSHSEAQYSLGVCYANGQGVPKDEAEAVKWFRKAADQSYPYAQYNLANCYVNGQGVPKDYAEAVKWLRKAAEQNVPWAQYNLAFCYANGHGLRKNYLEAVKWYRKAAEQNVPEAQYNLATCYANGQGVRKNYAEKVKWYRKAAEQGLASAETYLGLCYAIGTGVTKDDVQAVKWYRKAAEQNYPGAQGLLGECYYLGMGVAKNYVEAYTWLLLAAGQGEDFAQRYTTELENKMTREQIAEGQSLARNFKPRKALPAGSDSSPVAIAESRPESSGTAFFITDDGYLITNGHVIGESMQVRVVTAAGILPAKVVKVDAGNDLALLKAEGTFVALPVVASRATKLGGTVFTVGFPNLGLQGFAPKLSRGEIGSLAGPQDDPRYFQISAPVQPGNSGGALVDEHGNVIGVVAAKLSAKEALLASGALPENVNYAVKSSFLLGFLESVPEVAAKLKDPNTAVIKSEDVVERAEKAAALALVY
jgi:TPR repeat protein